MTAPLDLDAIRARAEAAGKILALIQGGPGGLVGPSAADVPVLLAELERLRAESVPRSALERLKDWRWCKAKNSPEVWEDGNGCLWCTDDTDHPRLYLNRKDADV